MVKKAPVTSRTASALELLLFLGGVPLLALMEPGYATRRILLVVSCVYALWRLYGRVDWRYLGGMPPSGWWRVPLARGVLVAGCALIYVWVVEPDSLFSLIRERPMLWLLIVFAYPLLSVLPQELIFRVYLFEVHAGAWSKKPWLAMGVSALFFAWMHIVFTGWFAVVTTLAGGLLLADTYVRARAKPGVLWVVALEHSLYGLAMFTVGLGKYFFMSR